MLHVLNFSILFPTASVFFFSFYPCTCSLRVTGSIALDMCYVAAGQSDIAYQELTGAIDIWDIAAGTIIVREAGGVVLDTTGSGSDVIER